jgi:hypothetical protein
MYTCRHCQGGADSDYQRVESCVDSDDSDSDYLSRIVTIWEQIVTISESSPV